MFSLSLYLLEVLLEGFEGVVLYGGRSRSAPSLLLLHDHEYPLKLEKLLNPRTETVSIINDLSP